MNNRQNKEIAQNGLVGQSKSLSLDEGVVVGREEPVYENLCSVKKQVCRVQGVVRQKDQGDGSGRGVSEPPISRNRYAPTPSNQQGVMRPSPPRVLNTHGHDNDRICPKVVSGVLAAGLLFFFVAMFLSSLYCLKYETISDCYCDNREVKGQEGSYQKLDIPAHLEEGLYQFKTAIKNKDCFKMYSWDSKCEGLVNYADVMVGGSISSIGNTEEMPNPLLCRCLDTNLRKQLCIPDQGECRICACDKIDADMLITEEDKLIPGRSWAFRGVGQLQIHLCYPIIILGVTIHHPAKALLPPILFKAAPKDFELWGINDQLDKDPYLLGTFQYKEHGGITQIFEVQNPTPTFYSQVKFSFITNHGNPNYTAVYKLEVHGLMES